MRDRVVSILGAGNLRCGPLVLASLATWTPDDLVTIKLFDASEERLDLFDRFLRECIDRATTEHVVMAMSSVHEALDGSTDAVFCVHEDCARRMMGRLQPELFDPKGPEVDQYRGDPNRPTPPENLSRQTQTFLSSPIDRGETREEAISQALATMLEHVPEGCRLLSLERGVALPTTREYLQLDWPDALSEVEKPTVPHQVLRWIQGDDSLEVLLETAKTTPMAQWLNNL